MIQKVLSYRWLIIALTISFFTFQYFYLLRGSSPTLAELDEISPNNPPPTAPCPICPVPPVTDVSGYHAAVLPIFVNKSNSSALISKLANHGDWSTEWFQRTYKLLYSDEVNGEIQYHRKRWELTYIANAVLELGLCGKGKKGMVWAAGKEILISFFAGRGCSILASDMPPENADNQFWASSDQFAATKDDLYVERFLDKKSFDKLVSYRTQDMNFVPIDLRENFDFMWSTCSVEHVGSIFLGQRFIVESLALLKPGGYAFHTTEFTLSSIANTVDSGITVLWRKPDVEYLVHALQVLGYEVMPVDFNAGTEPYDQKIDVPPYTPNPHIKLQIGQHVSTSFGFIIKKPLDWVNKGPKDYHKCK